MKKCFYLIIAAMSIMGATICSGTQISKKDLARTIDRLMTVSFRSDSLGLIEVTGEFRRFTDDPELGYLAHYYIAFGKWQSLLRQLNIGPGSRDAIRLLHEAIAELEIAIELKDDFADAYALSLNCHYPLYYLQPDQRGQLAPKVTALKEKALELGPENPRVVLTDAQNIFYTPEQFGGSQEKGVARYREAIKLFEQDAGRQSGVLPDWGHEIAYAWLGNAYLMLNPPDIPKAEQAFEKSLELRPDFAWVKDTMLPRVREQLSGK